MALGDPPRWNYDPRCTCGKVYNVSDLGMVPPCPIHGSPYQGPWPPPWWYRPPTNIKYTTGTDIAGVSDLPTEQKDALIKKARREGYDDGYSDGYTEGFNDSSHDEGYKKGYSEGWDHGFREGPKKQEAREKTSWEEGYDKGYKDAKAVAIELIKDM